MTVHALASVPQAFGREMEWTPARAPHPENARLAFQDIRPQPDDPLQMFRLVLDNSHGAHRSRCSIHPFDREEAELKSMAREQIEIRHIFEVVILARLHHAMRFPELLSLEHRPYR